MILMNMRIHMLFFWNLLLLLNFASSNEDLYANFASTSCNAHALKEKIMEDGTNNLSGSEFCRLFQQVSNQMLNILPDFHLNKSHINNEKFGPFVLEDEVMYVFEENNYYNMKLMIQNVQCIEEDTSNDKTSKSDARVSAIFILVPALVDPLTAFSRTALSGLNLSAEGVWNSSKGQLCMIGSVVTGMDAKVSMYLPRALSISQNSIIFGSIEGLFSPLQFNLIQKPYYLELRYGWYADSYLSYNYSKIKNADEFRKKRRPFNLISSIFSNSQLSLLKYPSIHEAGGLFSLDQICDLTDELYVDTEVANAVPRTSIKLEVISIGSFLARYDFVYKVRREGSLQDAKTLFNDNGLLNISLSLTISTSGNSSTILLMEGIYDPHNGVMYLIGCGKVHQDPHEFRDGLDCLIEVEIQYPPTNLRWLKDPTIKISIMSQRESTDPLYVSPIKIESKTITYDIFKPGMQELDVAFRNIFEGVLRVLVLLVEIALIWSQKLYMERNIGLASLVSLNMFALQILIFSILLIFGPEILLPSKEAFSFKIHPYEPLFIGLDYAAKLLVLVALFLNTILFCKVSKSRKTLNDEESSKKPLALGGWRFFVPIFKRLGILLVYFSILLSLVFPKEGMPVMEIVQGNMVDFLTIFTQILHNHSLLSQIVENWRQKNQTKSLRKLYYIGLPVLKIIPKFYDCIRTPISDPYLTRNLHYIGIIGLISQVIIVHVQQNYSYFGVINSFKAGRFLNPWNSRHQ